jgi:hypothetical protein
MGDSMSIILQTLSNGSITLSEQDTASNITVTIPATTGTLNTSGAVNEVPAGTVSAPAITTTGDTNTGIFFPAADTIAFTEGGVEAARFDSSGNLLVGTTSSSGKLTVQGAGDTLFSKNTAASGFAIVARTDFTSSNGNIIALVSSSGIVGTITTNNSSTAYNTTSDYRLKENVVPMTGALEKIAALKPCTYKWKATGEVAQGFIAHELQAVVPDCVTGEKDAVRTVDLHDDEGKVIGTKEEPQYQGVDVSFLVATLTAAIQEQQALITQLQADVAALKGAA